jgi:hypothetical protein
MMEAVSGYVAESAPYAFSPWLFELPPGPEMYLQHHMPTRRDEQLNI